MVEGTEPSVPESPKGMPFRQVRRGWFRNPVKETENNMMLDRHMTSWLVCAVVLHGMMLIVPCAAADLEPVRLDQIVDYGTRGRVKLTTLTKEFFMPGFLERDEVIRTPPIALYPWDGVADVRPFGKLETSVVEGVY